MEHYYIKKGNRYQKVKPFFGFPSDGVWVVKDAGKSNQLILKLCDIDGMEAIDICVDAKIKHQLKEAIVRRLLKNDKYVELLVDNGESIDDVAGEIADGVLSEIRNPSSVDENYEVDIY